MSDPFVAEIRIFGFDFPPTGWAFCDGDILSLSQNTALFSLLGTTYGGDGKSNFALPDLQGQTPVQQGQGAGLSLYDLGEETGSETVTLLDSEMPSHQHLLEVRSGLPPALLPTPSAETVMARSSGGFAYVAPVTGHVAAMNVQTVSSQGGGEAHDNLMPYLVLNFCIALQGVFPPRS